MKIRKIVSRINSLVLTVSLLLSTFLCSSQEAISKAELLKITQVPPNAASLGKYGEIPVSLYSGIPNIEIPITQISSGRINLPISLSYHAGGIKVEEIASWVGLGWSLNAGGVISRTVMGLPDEVESASNFETFLTPQRPVEDMVSKTWSDSAEYYRNYLRRILMQDLDAEPDVYYFNFGKLSGKFYYHQKTGKFYSVPFSNLKIEYIHNPSGPDNGNFIITDTEGIQYTFSVKETSERDYSTAATVMSISVVTSWYLSNIYDPVSQQSTTFHYTNHTLFYPTISSSINYTPSPFIGTDYHFESKQSVLINAVKLKRITFNQGTIAFETGLRRCDLPTDSALTSIKVFDIDNVLRKDVQLSYDYFTARNYTPQERCFDLQTSVNKRLKLLGVDSKPMLGSTQSPQSYKMEYADHTPSRLSFSQDHWGYYNGANNTTLIPPAIVPYQYPQKIHLPGGDRSVHPEFTQAGILKRLIYPTGGYSDFIYENNTAANESLPATTTAKQVSSAQPVPGYSEMPFTVNSLSCSANDNKPGVYIDVEMTGLDFDLIREYGYPGLSADIKIIKADTNEEAVGLALANGEKWYNNTPGRFYLPNGNYKIVTDFANNPFGDTYSSTAVTIKWVECEADSSGGINRYGGGLRIKKVINYADTLKPATIRAYRYTDGMNSFITSGQTKFIPIYSYEVGRINGSTAGDGNQPNTRYLKRFSYSNYPLVNGSGRSVGYSNVIEMDGESGQNGYTIYKYSNYSEYDDQYYETGNIFPIGSPSSYDWLRGLELERKVYKNTNGSYFLAKHIMNEYDTALLGVNKKVMVGVKGGWISTMTGPVEFTGEDYNASGFSPMIRPYKVFSDFVYLKKTTERSYNGLGNNTFIEQIKQYDYSSKSLLPARIEGLNSKGENEILTIKYPKDFEVANPNNLKAQSILNLQQGNYVSSIIEEFKERQVGAAKQLIAARLNSYKGDKPLIDTIFSFDNVNPLSVNNYPGVAISSSNNSIHNGYAPKIIFSQYHSDNNNLLEQRKVGDNHVSYVWGYNGVHPIAQVYNASHNQVAYTSFEDNEYGGWIRNTGGTLLNNSVITGKKSYSGGMNKTVPTGNYKVTLWAAANASVNGIVGTPLRVSGRNEDWRYFEWNLSNVSTIQVLADNMDEVRLYPSAAQMTTYTYEPLVGMTSQTDMNNRTIYYEYDGFNRLSLIKDEESNILKKYCYNHQGQVEVCGIKVYTSTEKSNTFYKQCTDGGIGSAVIYNVVQGKYTSTISQQDADNKALTEIAQSGQTYANQIGTCTWSSDIRSGTFTKQCNDGGTGTSHIYSVAAGSYTSIVSKADANQKAQDAVTANGQAYVNQVGGCTWRNDAMSDTYTKACTEGGVGSAVVYSVATNTYSSTVSKIDANQKALNDLAQNGQSYANQNGSCNWINDAKSATFAKQCVEGGTGSSVTYTVAAGSYNSIISKADANNKALAHVSQNGQAYANNNGYCTWTNDIQSYTFTKQCSAGGTGTTHTYTVVAGLYSSTISKVDANQKALNVVNANGQNYANQQGTCTYYNQQRSQSFQKQCTPGETGNWITYYVWSGTHSSTISQADADQKAVNDINANGQAYANTHGTCTPPATVFAKLSIENVWYSGYSQYGDVVVRFYSDQACTQPVSASLVLNYQEEHYYADYYGSNTNYTSYTHNVNGHEVVLVSGTELYYWDDLYTQSVRNYYLLASSQYTIAY